MDNKEWQVPRGPAATRAKNKYRNSNYDRVELALPAGMKKYLTEAAKQQGLSNNAYVAQALKEKYLRDTGKEMMLEKGK